MTARSTAHPDAASDPERDALDRAADIGLATLRAAGVAGVVSVGRSDHWQIKVRGGAIETVSSAVTRGLRITAYAAGNRCGACTASDLDPASVTALARRAAELAAYGDADPCAGLPDAGECGLASGDLELDDPAVAALDRDTLVQTVIAAERVALAHDPRILASHRSGASCRRGESVFATTDGVRSRHGGTSVGFHVIVVAEADGEKQHGWYATADRFLAGLKSAEAVGREAGRRAVQLYGWKAPPTGPTRVLLHREAAGELLGAVAQAASGGRVYRGATWLHDQLGQRIAADTVTIVDDPLIPRAQGSRPCDGEGVRSRRVNLVENGRLTTFLVDAYAARRLKHPYTGHSGGTANLSLLPGPAGWDELVAELGTGLIVTEFHGNGVDLASGSFSKGVSGFWVEHGRVVHPVQEATVGGNLRQLLPGIRAIGNDPEDQTTVSSPSLLIDGFTVGGK